MLAQAEAGWLQATREAVRVMLAAVTATGEAAKRVDATLAELQQLQVSCLRLGLSLASGMVRYPSPSAMTAAVHAQARPKRA